MFINGRSPSSHRPARKGRTSLQEVETAIAFFLFRCQRMCQTLRHARINDRNPIRLLLLRFRNLPWMAMNRVRFSTSGQASLKSFALMRQSSLTSCSSTPARSIEGQIHFSSRVMYTLKGHQRPCWHQEIPSRSTTARMTQRKCRQKLHICQTYPTPETEKERSSVDYPQVFPSVLRLPHTMNTQILRYFLIMGIAQRPLMRSFKTLLRTLMLARTAEGLCTHFAVSNHP